MQGHLASWQSPVLHRHVMSACHSTRLQRCSARQRSRRSVLMRSKYDPRREQDLRPYVPSAPPPKFVPPPPPPGPPRTLSGGFPRFNRRGILAIMFGGALAEWAFLNSQGPKFEATGSRGVGILTTRGGNKLAVTYDGDKRLWMYDSNGNLYYDTGDDMYGWNMVERVASAADDEDELDSIVYNLSTNESGQVVKTRLGTLRDMTSQQVDEIGGVPLEQLREEFRKLGYGSLEGDTVVGFQDDREIDLPFASLNLKQAGKDGIVGTLDEDGNEVPLLFPAPFLEEGGIMLEERNMWRRKLFPWLPEPNAIDSMKDDPFKRGRG